MKAVLTNCHILTEEQDQVLKNWCAGKIRIKLPNSKYEFRFSHPYTVEYKLKSELHWSDEKEYKTVAAWLPTFKSFWDHLNKQK